MVKKKYLRFKKQIENFLFDHYIVKSILSYVGGFFVAAVAAAVFAFGFACFTTPAKENGFILATGGVSGLSQIIALLIEVIHGETLGNNLVQSIGYTLFNIPLLVFSFFKIGKKFTIFTLVNVVLSSLFIPMFTAGGVGKAVAGFKFADGTMPLDPIIVRVLFAGICTGLSSAFAFAAGISCGGIDIVAQAFNLKKGVSIGVFSMIANIILAIIGGIIDKDPTTTLYTFIFIIICNLVVDKIHTAYNYLRIDVITTEKEAVSSALLNGIKRGCTIMDVQGAYTKVDKFDVFMVISSYELEHAKRIINDVDPRAFIMVLPVKRIIGAFFKHTII